MENQTVDEKRSGSTRQANVSNFLKVFFSNLLSKDNSGTSKALFSSYRPPTQIYRGSTKTNMAHRRAALKKRQVKKQKIGRGR